MDVLRLLAVSLVMYEHLVPVATFAKSLPLIFNNQTILPVLNRHSWDFWIIESGFVRILNTETAVLGVLLFFIITGYLIAGMLERYRRAEFIINRIFRIFPALIISCLIIGLLVYKTQGVTFTLASYLSSFTVSYLYVEVVPVNGVLWTLIIEVFFYIIAFVVGRFTCMRLFTVQAICLGIIIFSVIDANKYLYITALNIKYILFILVGVTIKLAEKMASPVHKLQYVILSEFIAFMGFRIYMIGHPDTASYSHFSSQAIVIIIFMLFYLKSDDFFNKLPQIFFKAAELVYPLYLLHVPFGLITMYLLKGYFHNSYILLIFAILLSYLSAFLLHVTVEKPGIKMGRIIANNYNRAILNFKLFNFNLRGIND